jgi:signal transduction histidine kinase
LALAGGFAAAGLVVRSRRRLLEVLQQRTDELARQRDRTAELAVQADRARVSEDLELAIASRIEVIATAVEQGRQMLETGDTEQSRAALREIEQQGRETLAQMRTVVGSLHDAPTDPAPGLADLGDLLERAGSDARLTTSGAPRSLGPHLELAAYRIVEQLVTTLGERPDDRVEVVVQFAPDTLHVRVTGPRRRRTNEERRASVAAATSAAQARAQVLGGRVAVVAAGDRHEVDVSLPIPVPMAG